MKIENIAALLIRFIGAFIVIIGLLGAANAAVGMYMAKIGASVGTDGADAYARQSASQFGFSAVLYTFIFVAGCHLIVASRRWGRFFAKGLDDQAG